MEIDPQLTEIDICLLVGQVGLPFSEITDEEIQKCVDAKIFLTTNAIYNSSNDPYSYKQNKFFDMLKIATIANEIQNGTYNFNYPIPIWDDDEADSEDEDDDEPSTPKYETDGNGEYHIRAFHFCKRNIYLSVNRSG